LLDLPRLKFYLALLAAIAGGQWVFSYLTGIVPGAGALNPTVSFLISTFIVGTILIFIMRKLKASP